MFSCWICHNFNFKLITSYSLQYGANSRRCSFLFIYLLNILCYTYGCTTLFFPMGKKIDLDKKTSPSPLTLFSFFLSYKKPTPLWGEGGNLSLELPQHHLVVPSHTFLWNLSTFRIQRFQLR